MLRSGLYVVRSFVSTSEEQAYVVYWPEDTTWDDRAASPIQRNRVTFMRYRQSPHYLLLLIDRICRYLSKLCDQVVCLLSTEHSKAIVWNEADDQIDKEEDDWDDDSDSSSTDSKKGDSSRVYHFKVAKTKDQEENVVVREGFQVRLRYNNSPLAVTLAHVRYKMTSPLIVHQTLPAEEDLDPRAFSPVLLHGEKVQGFMTATFVPARTINEPFTHDYQTADQLRLRL